MRSAAQPPRSRPGTPRSSARRSPDPQTPEQSGGHLQAQPGAPSRPHAQQAGLVVPVPHLSPAPRPSPQPHRSPVPQYPGAAHRPAGHTQPPHHPALTSASAPGGALRRFCDSRK